MLNLMLNIRTLDDLYGHPSAGACREGLVVEQVFAHLPPAADCGFYRTAAGAELDLVVTAGRRRIGFEAKFSTAPKPTRGFWQALDDLGIKHAWVVAPVDNGYRLDERVEVIPVHEIPRAIATVA